MGQKLTIHAVRGMGRFGPVPVFSTLNLRFMRKEVQWIYGLGPKPTTESTVTFNAPDLVSGVISRLEGSLGSDFVGKMLEEWPKLTTIPMPVNFPWFALGVEPFLSKAVFAAQEFEAGRVVLKTPPISGSRMLAAAEYMISNNRPQPVAFHWTKNTLEA